MNLKQLFNMAFISRLTSLLCLGIFFYCYITELDIRMQMLALSFSFTGWIIGSFFIGLFRSAQALAFEKEFEVIVEAAPEVVKDVTDVDEEKTYSHPLFKDDDNE